MSAAAVGSRLLVADSSGRLWITSDSGWEPVTGPGVEVTALTTLPDGRVLAVHDSLATAPDRAGSRLWLGQLADDGSLVWTERALR